MGLFSSSRARLARSVVDWRLSGVPVRATTSQAIEMMTALSRGGKDGLAATSRIVLESETACGPALPPQPDGVGVQVDPRPGFRTGKRGSFLEEQHQAGA